MSILPQAMVNSAAYKLLLKREREQKPALITHRKAIIEKMKRDNYKDEYNRILGLLEGHAERFNIPGGHWQKDKLTNRLQMLKKLFNESHNPPKHPIEGK
jgi:hypothetical protein